MADQKNREKSCKIGVPKNITEEDIYHMMMLHSYQHKSCSEIAKQFGISRGKVYEIIAKRTNSGCCG